MTFRKPCEAYAAQDELRVARAGFCAMANRLCSTCVRVGKTLRCDSGQAIAETAIALVVAISVAFWLFELSMFTYTCSVLNQAAQEGVRYAIMHGTDSSACSGPDTACTDKSPYSNVQTVVTSAASASLHDTSAMTVTVTYGNSTAVAGNPVTVTVVYTYVPYVNFPGIKNTVTFSSQGRIMF